MDRVSQILPYSTQLWLLYEWIVSRTVYHLLFITDKQSSTDSNSSSSNISDIIR